jgi:uncharacterized membrane protein
MMFDDATFCWRLTIVHTFVLQARALCITVMALIGIFQLVIDFECTVHYSIGHVWTWQRGISISCTNMMPWELWDFMPFTNVSWLSKCCRCSIAEDMDVVYAIGKNTILECVMEFTSTLVELYEAEYLRPPKKSEV